MEFQPSSSSCVKHTTNSENNRVNRTSSVDSGTMPSDMDINPNSTKNTFPYLEILVQPQSKFRFRYKSEMTGKHGSLLGIDSTTSLNNGLKMYPTVKLHNFSSVDASIRCSIVCETPPYKLHPHILELQDTSRQSPYETEEMISNPAKNYVEIPISSNNDYTAIFQGMNIIYTGKKSMKKELANKLLQIGESSDSRKIDSAQVDEITSGINLNVVRLCFEAVVKKSDSSTQSISAPIYSSPIQHNKSILTGDLRIVRIDKCTSSCVGDEEIFALVEKVDKHNIQVKFFELNHKGQEVWKAYGKFSKLDVHHQYAIVFKTPPYRSIDIETEVDVWIQLERPSDEAISDKIPFKYKPIRRVRKMPKRESRNNLGRRSSSVESNDSHHHPTSQNRNIAAASSSRSGHRVATDSSTSGSAKQNSEKKFPCDFDKISSITEEEVRGNKGLALGIALSVGESLHNWAETSNFTCVLEKLRHLLCLVNENGDNALHTSIINQQKEPFKRILSTINSSPDISSIINEPNIQNLTPLALAVLTNGEDFVRDLVHNGADLSISNSDGDLPLHLAVNTNHINCLKQLVISPSISEVINCFNYNSMTPLHLAVSEGSLDSINLLCHAKANLSVQEGTYGRTPLHIAVEKNNFASALILLKSAGDKDIVNIQNYRGDTPLHCAASSELPSMCALLLFFGADPLIENYVQVNEDDEDESGSGQTVLDVSNSNLEILKVLQGTNGDWEAILKIYTNLPDYKAERDKLLSLESLHVDSGIDIKDLTQ